MATYPVIIAMTILTDVEANTPPLEFNARDATRVTAHAREVSREARWRLSEPVTGVSLKVIQECLQNLSPNSVRVILLTDLILICLTQL